MDVDEYTLKDIVSYFDIDTIIIIHVLGKYYANIKYTTNELMFYSRYIGITNNSKRIAKYEYSKYKKIQPDYLKCSIVPACKMGHIEMVEFLINEGMIDWCQWLFDIYNERTPKIKEIITKYEQNCSRCHRTLEEHLK